MKRYIISLIHLFNGTIATMAAGIVVRKFVMGLYQTAFGRTSSVNFEIQSFLPFFICIGVLAGYVTYVRVGGNVAFWIWTVPLAILLIRILAFHSPSIFESGITAGIKYFFGEARCSASVVDSLAYMAERCLNRLIYLGLVSSALSYSTGAFLSYKKLWPELSMLMRRSGSPR